MKPYMLYVVMATIAITAIGGCYYYYLNQTSSAYVVLFDVTSDNVTKINTGEVPSHIEATSSLWSSTDIRFTTLSNFQQNKVIDLHLPAEFPLLGNPDIRNDEIQNYNRKIIDTVNRIVSHETGRPLSVLYAPIARSLNWLASRDVKNKEAIIYTDACENTSSFSIYNYPNGRCVLNDSIHIKAMFEKELPLDSLKGIRIYLIYNASDTRTEDLFFAMSNIWKSIYETKGAKVIVAPNLSI
jgi:hypothetical protein